MDSIVDVAIVGAGLAGLYAHRLLVRAGLSTCVLEARGRVGGRVFSERVGGCAVDLGAQWIGPDQLRIQRLVQEFGLPTCATHFDGLHVHRLASGQVVRSESELPPLSWVAGADAWLIGRAIDRTARRLAKIGQPWRAADAAMLDAVTMGQWLRRRAWTTDGPTPWADAISASECCSIDEISALEVLHNLASAGGIEPIARAEQTFLVDGAQALADRLAEEVPAGRLHLGDAVGRICVRGEMVEVHPAVRCQLARQVIVTGPPQVTASILFDPPLPERAAALSHVRSGKVRKLVMLFATAWWREPVDGEAMSGLASSPQGPVRYLLDASSPDGQPGVLVALVTADAVDLSVWQSEEATIALLRREVTALLGRCPQPVERVMSHDWQADPWSLGGYVSRLGLGGWTTHQDALSRSYGPVHFAGSDIASSWRGYMEGALASGEVAAKQVLATFARQA